MTQALLRSTRSSAWLLCCLASACGGGSGSTVQPGQTTPTSLDGLVSLVAPRIALPGQIQWLLETEAGNTQVAGLTSAAFTILENGIALAPAAIELRLLPLAPAVRDSYCLLIDSSETNLQDAAKVSAIESAAQISLARILAADHTEVLLARLGAQGAEPWPLTGGVLWSRDAGLLQAGLNALLTAPALGGGLALFAGVEQAQDLVEARIQEANFELPARALRGSVICLAAGNDTSGQVSLPFDPKAPLRRVGLAIGSADLSAVMTSAGIATWNGSLPPEQSALFQDLVARRIGGLYRLAYLSPKRDGDGPVALAVTANDGNQAASILTQFSSTGFSDGAGHLDVQPISTVDTGGPVERAHRAVALDGQGRIWTVTDLQPQGLAISRRSLAGALDSSFGDQGRLILLPAGTATQWRGVDIRTDGQSDRAFVLTQRTAPEPGGSSVVRGVVLEVNSTGVITEVQLPAASGDSASDFVAEMQRDASGRWWIVGSSDGTVVAPRQRALWRLQPSLAVDTGFSNGGSLVHQVDGPSTISETGVSLTLAQVNGALRIYVAGQGPNFPLSTNTSEATLVAFNEDGSLATDFAQQGILRSKGTFHDYPGGFASFTRVRVDGQNRVLMAGSIEAPWDSTQRLPAIWRMDEAGVPDALFGLDFFNAFALNNPYGALGLWAPVNTLAEAPAVEFAGSGQFSDLWVNSSDGLFASGWRSGPAGNLDAIWVRLVPAGVVSINFNKLGYLIHDQALVPGGSELPARIAGRDGGPLITAGAVSATVGQTQVWPLLVIDNDPTRAF